MKCKPAKLWCAVGLELGAIDAVGEPIAVVLHPMAIACGVDVAEFCAEKFFLLRVLDTIEEDVVDTKVCLFGASAREELTSDVAEKATI